MQLNPFGCIKKHSYQKQMNQKMFLREWRSELFGTRIFCTICVVFAKMVYVYGRIGDGQEFRFGRT